MPKKSNPTPAVPWPWAHFTPDELRCRCGCGRCEMDAAFMDKLEAARVAAGVPFVVTSGYRCPDHDRAVGTSSTPGAGPHTTGKAADIGWPPEKAFAILVAAVNAGLRGLGMHGRGRPAVRYIHLDDLEPRAWTY